MSTITQGSLEGQRALVTGTTARKLHHWHHGRRRRRTPSDL